jgi:thiamine transport system substrate-binding protein
MGRLSLLASLLIAGSLYGGGARAELVRALTYGSMTGEGSLAELLEKEFPLACPGCAVKFVTTHETSGLLGRLRADHRRAARSSSAADVVMGLGAESYRAALEEKLIAPGSVFQKSVFALIADTQHLPPSKWPRRWAEVDTKLAQKVLLQDPRVSGTGIGWLRVVFDQHALSVLASKKAGAKVFPSWSASYEAFLAGHAPVVWSYLTSEAYHRCQPHPSDRYRAIPLEDGYPEQQEWIAVATGTHRAETARKLVELVLSRKIQQSLPLKTWMYPAQSDTPLPPCFAGVTPLKSVPEHAHTGTKELNRWIDEWSL